jgi:hypothetical protein
MQKNILDSSKKLIAKKGAKITIKSFMILILSFIFKLPFKLTLQMYTLLLKKTNFFIKKKIFIKKN